MKQGPKVWFGIAAALSAALACGSMGDDARSLDGSFDPDDNANGGTASQGGPGTGGTQSQLPQPEQEVARAFQVPVVSGRWVWTANPSSGRVALIDAKTFVVKTALAGAGPTYLTALPPLASGGSRALVINSVSQDATLLSASADGDIEVTTTLAVHEGANAWAVTADGRFAIAWTDASTTPNADPSEGFQDITVLDLARDAPTSKRLGVGYRPARVFMDDDDRYAYVVSDAGIDVVDLLAAEGPTVEREVELSLHPASDTAKRDVNMTPDGTLAFVSREGKAYVTVVDMQQGTFKDVALPGVVTDLDLSADASMAVAIVRQATQPPEAAGPAGDGGEGGQTAGAAAAEGGAGGLAGGGGAPSEPGTEPAQSLAVLLPVASIYDSPELFDTIAIGELFGSVELGAQGAIALLYSNAVPSNRLTLLDLSEGGGFEHRTLDLRLPVFSAVSTPDGAHAIALLRPPAGSAMPGAFAVVSVTKNLPSKIQGTEAATVPAEPSKAAMVAIDDERAVVTVSDDASQTHVAYLVRMPELVVDPIPLASAPLLRASGIVPDANKAFVAQQHPEGRITFIDLTSGAARTLTGFELSTEVGKK